MVVVVVVIVVVVVVVVVGVVVVVDGSINSAAAAAILEVGAGTNSAWSSVSWSPEPAALEPTRPRSTLKPNVQNAMALLPYASVGCFVRLGAEARSVN